MKQKYTYMASAACIAFITLLLIISMIVQNDYHEYMDVQNDKVLTLKKDSVLMARDLKHLLEWHSIAPGKKQSYYINYDKKRRIQWTTL